MFHHKGFTLIEIMIVVLIIGIISALAYPGYANYVLRAGRADGQAMLSSIMQAQERYYSQNQTYVTNLGSGGLGFGVAQNAAVPSEDKRYNITAAACSGSTIANCVVLTATRTGAQLTDSACGNLSLDSRGTKGKSGTAALGECW
ncbi:type IV pilin protein [Atopomonas hussainii]|uniref:type IV pilin protein n=1 Tax=Atopomonas hussainii TaxID=1429083 RepID=UPI000900243E|nr:type IV pilin protein [Atopomonas hussainii]